MILDYRSYAGKFFRPSPIIIEMEESQSFLILTAWGATSEGRSLAENMKEYFLTAAQAKGPSATEEILGSVLKFGNEYLLTKVNQTGYKLAVEAVALRKVGSILYLSAVGCPHIFIKNGASLHPINYEVDWTFQKKDLSPLPAKALGIDSNITVKTGFVEISNQSSMVLLSRSEVPGSFYSLNEWDREKVTALLAKDSVDMPFWLGLVKF